MVKFLSEASRLRKLPKVVVFLESNTNGAGLLFFRRAPDLGLRPILFSVHPEWYHFLSGFENVRLAEMTELAVLQAIDQLGRDRVAGIWSALDEGVELAARVSPALGLHTVDPSAIALCNDKFLTRQALAAAGIRDVGFALARSSDEAAAAARVLGRVVVKPRTFAGGAGVKICSLPDEARHHFERAARDFPETRDEGMIVEEFIDGPQFACEIFDGVSLGVTRQHTGGAHIAIGQDFPPLEDPGMCSEIAAHAERAVAAVGHRRGPAHPELRYGKQGPCIIEINPRLAGAMITQNVLLATGIDLIEATLRFACGMSYDLARRHARGSATRYLLRSGMPVRKLLGCEEARNVAGVVEVGVFREKFTRGGPAKDTQDRIAYVLSEAPTTREAVEIAETARAKLRIAPDAKWRRIARKLFLSIPRRIAKALMRGRPWTHPHADRTAPMSTLDELPGHAERLRVCPSQDTRPKEGAVSL